MKFLFFPPNSSPEDFIEVWETYYTLVGLQRALSQILSKRLDTHSFP